MSLSCPNCQSRNLRYSRVRSFSERCWSLFGVRPLRCRDCRTRFIDRTWRPGNVRFARCPLCWRMDLARWSENDYYVPLFKRILLRLGARPYRCEYCRANFVSFRTRRDRYRRRSSVEAAAGPEAAATDRCSQQPPADTSSIPEPKPEN